MSAVATHNQVGAARRRSRRRRRILVVRQSIALVAITPLYYKRRVCACAAIRAASDKLLAGQLSDTMK